MCLFNFRFNFFPFLLEDIETPHGNVECKVNDTFTENICAEKCAYNKTSGKVETMYCLKIYLTYKFYMSFWFHVKRKRMTWIVYSFNSCFLWWSNFINNRFSVNCSCYEIVYDSRLIVYLFCYFRSFSEPCTDLKRVSKMDISEHIEHVYASS